MPVHILVYWVDKLESSIWRSEWHYYRFEFRHRRCFFQYFSAGCTLFIVWEKLRTKIRRKSTNKEREGWPRFAMIIIQGVRRTGRNCAYLIVCTRACDLSGVLKRAREQMGCPQIQTGQWRGNCRLSDVEPDHLSIHRLFDQDVRRVIRLLLLLLKCTINIVILLTARFDKKARSFK